MIGADSYILFVEELFSFPPRKYNQTFTTLGGQVDGLTPSTTYNCYVFSSNSAGRGAKSSTKTLMTCKCTSDVDYFSKGIIHVTQNIKVDSR